MRHCKAEAMSWEFVREGGGGVSVCVMGACVRLYTYLMTSILYSILHDMRHCKSEAMSQTDTD